MPRCRLIIHYHSVQFSSFTSLIQLHIVHSRSIRSSFIQSNSQFRYTSFPLLIFISLHSLHQSLLVSLVPLIAFTNYIQYLHFISLCLKVLTYKLTVIIMFSFRYINYINFTSIKPISSVHSFFSIAFHTFAIPLHYGSLTSIILYIHSLLHSLHSLRVSFIHRNAVLWPWLRPSASATSLH